jgi:PqqD family protein of HPr-rel-A system
LTGRHLAPPAARWLLADDVLWRTWDGEVIAYSGMTGSTHHFTEFAAWLFLRLAAAPSTVGELCADAGAEVELTGDGTIEQSVADTLRSLSDLLLATKAAAAAAAH